MFHQVLGWSCLLLRAGLCLCGKRHGSLTRLAFSRSLRFSGNAEKFWVTANGSADSLRLPLLKISCLQPRCLSPSLPCLRKPAGSSWWVDLGAGGQGTSAAWGGDAVFRQVAVLLRAGPGPAAGLVSEGEGGTRERTLAVSAILWAKRNRAGPSAGGGGAARCPPAPVRGGLPAAAPRWACPGSLRWGSGGSPSGQPAASPLGQRGGRQGFSGCPVLPQGTGLEAPI